MIRAGAAAGLALVTGCAAGGGPPRQPLTEFVKRLKPVANPGQVAADDLTFSREARSRGMTAAIGASATPEAATRMVSGPLAAERWLSLPGANWSPRIAWSSCDGSLAVTGGIFATADASWGRYATVWERAGNGDRRVSYTFGLPDADLTRLRRARAAAAVEEGDIVVEGADLIEGKVADCTAPPPPPAPDGPVADGIAQDRTLRWAVTRDAAGHSRFAADAWNGTGWDRAVSVPLSAGAGQ